ncbi:Ryanodine receptor [Dirofilaria immitis]
MQAYKSKFSSQLVAVRFTYLLFLNYYIFCFETTAVFCHSNTNSFGRHLFITTKASIISKGIYFKLTKMTDKEGTGDGEQDDISFLRTGDIVAMTCMASANREGVLGSERVCLCTEGFGNRMCSLENVSDRDLPPDISMCMLYIDNALSVRALQEMMSNDNELKGASSSGGHKTLLYGHAVQLKHVQSEMYLACLSSCSSNDKLAFDVGVQENNEGEACWWTIHPASKQRSEGEKVRVGDDVILVSVATERYLHMTHSKGFMVIASFHQTLWNITSVSSGSVRMRNMGALFGNDVLRFFHGNDEVLTIPENWSEHPQHNMAIYEGGAAVSQARSLWRIELIRIKWHGALVGWEQPFRIRHITSGRYLGVMENVIQLYDKDKAEFDTTAFVMYQTKDLKKQLVEEKEEGMGIATIHYGETNAFIQHIKTELWLSYQTSEITKKGLGKVEEKKAVALKDGHMDDCFTFFMALEEESKSARVIRKCSSVLNRFLKGIEALQREGKQAQDWNRVDLNEVLKLMEDLIDYFAQPEEDDFETCQNRLRALRSRQDLFQEEGVLNMILDTIDKFSQMEAVPDFAELLSDNTQLVWEEISTYLYLLVAAMIKGNHYNCAQFASAQRLQWLFGRLSNPQSAEGILDVLYCVLTESPEALNMINESHIKSVISLLEKVGRDPKVLDVLSSLCEGNGMAVRSSQNTITQHLLPGKDLLLQTKMRDHVSSMTPNILVGVVEGSSQFRRWYYEAEVEHIEQMTKTKPYLRIGWANSMGYKPFPGSGDGWGCIGVGDDYYSYGFDGRCIYCATKKHIVWTRMLQKGDIVGCSLDLTIPEISFTVNGQPTAGLFKNFNIDGFFFPVMSLSAKVSCRFMFGGTEGHLRFGPPPGFSALIEAAANHLEIGECLSFGDIAKNVYTGPSILRQNTEPFVPVLVDISNVVLPEFAMEIHEKLAENLHELWAMRKIELGWSYGEVRDQKTRRHPCLTSFQQLPQNEKTYNINLAIDTMKTIEALRYHMILDEPPVRLRCLRLPQNYQQSNGFKPHPLDSHGVILDDNVFPLIDALAKNTHNVWAREKIRRGWTFGLNEFVNMNQKRTPHLVPYEVVDQRIKEANRESASEFVKALQLFGIFLESPVLEHDEGAEKELKATQAFSRTYRAEALYAVSSGKWYFEFEVLTSGFMKVGWMDVSAASTVDIGMDDRSYGFDGYLARKWHQGAGTYGREWKIGDIVGVFLDLSDHTISFSLNGELLLDPSGSEMAFDSVLITDGFVPAMTLSAGQKARLNFGQDSNSLKYFTTCGLQEGYEPFCVNMYRQMPMWYAKRLPQFEDIGLNSTIEVSRIPATGNSPPCLKITQKEIDTGDTTTQEKSKMEYIRLSLPVKCNDRLQRTKDKESIMRSLHEIEKRLGEEVQSVATIRHPTIPREFNEDVKGSKKSLGRSLLSAFKHSTEEDENLARLKPIPLEGDQLLETSDIRMSGSMLELSSNDEHREGKQKRVGLMAKFHQRKKEGMPGEIKRTTGILANGQVASADAISAKSVSPSILKDDQDMPRSGPGRYRRLITSGKSKKNKNEGLERRRPSFVALEQNIAVEGSVPSDDMRAMIELSDKIDEFYYAIRIFPGQDPANVWVGWVTPKYHFYAERFVTGEAVRRCKYQESNKNVNEGESLEYRNCYVINAAELLQSVPDAGNTKVSGLLIGCIIDTSVGELSFLASKQDTGFRFKLEPGAILYPAAFVAPTSAEVLQFELGRIKYTFPLSSAMFKSSHKSLLPFCPPRLTVEKLNPVHWARVPNECLRTTALKLSDFRGWSILCDDPVRIMSIYIPEKDTSYDILEMIEHNDFLIFHRQTLNLYCKLAAHGNQKVAHILCSHVDEDQIMYAVKSHYLSGPLRQGFHDFLIAVHLRTYVDARQSTSREYVIPLKQNLEIKNVFQPENENRFPQILGPTISIRPVVVCSEVRSDFGTDAELKLLPPAFNFAALKTHVMLALSSATEHAVINCRDLIGGNCLNHFEPLFKLFNSLLIIGIFDDDDMKNVLKLIHPVAFDEYYVPGLKQKGLTEIELAEGVKIQLTIMLENICDIQLRHRVESLVSFAAGFVGDLQQDQFSRYMSIKQTDMSPAEAARRTKEFRCPPREQMFRLMKCKAIVDDNAGMMLDDEAEYDQCPMDETLQQQLREFCSLLVGKIGCIKNEGRNEFSELIVLEEANSWVDQLAQLVIQVPPPLIGENNNMNHNGTENFRHMICTMLKSWATSSMIESNELIRKMFSLLLRQYIGVAEMIKALSQTYVLHERNIEDVQDFIENLVQVRELLNVQFQSTEEAVLKRGLWKLMNNRIFFQHPDLMRLLSVHENVMCIMMNVLTAQQGAADHGEHAEHIETIEEIAHAQESKDASEMVVACSRFLCYFCRTSRHNQKAMFEHLSFLLDNATMLLARPSLRGSVPLDIAYSSFMDNSELALALKEEELDKVTIYLSRCGLQPNLELIAKGYPDIGWDPVEGERYIDFLRFCVWINGESVEENANLVIRLLIRRPECLGVALKGEGQGLFSAFKEAIVLSEDIRALEENKNHIVIHSMLLREQPHYPSKEAEGDDYVDLGAATLDFYSSLVDLLAKCAPDKINIQAGKGDCMRARAILRSLISLDDLGQILALRFTIPNLVASTMTDDNGPLPGLLPNHKQSVLLFLDRVYGIDSQEMLFHFLEKSFLPDLRAATMMDSPSSLESDTALALNRYLCNAVLPLLTNHSYYLADAEHHAALLDTTLHTVYSMNRLRSLTKNQRDAVSDFLVAITHELPPSMMIKLMRKVITDIQEMDENLVVPLRILTLHYERCTKYYGSGNIYGIASETEKRLSMLLFYAIFDSLGSRQYDPELFGKALPCLTAIGSAISPDYTLTTTSNDTDKIQKAKDHGVWNPDPVDTNEIQFDDDLKSVIAKFAEHFHDSWASRKPNLELIAKGYPDIGWDPVEGERYIDFLRFCVWINGESVEENANLVIRLLIRRPECLGVALKGEGQGLFSAFKEAIVLSEDIRALEENKNHIVIHSMLLREQPHYPSKEAEGDDYVDLGAATLDFYSSLVDLLAKCAPDKINIQAGKGDCMRARAILRSLISLDDLGQILALRFTIPNLVASTMTDDNGPLPGLLPNHKQSVLLFLDRVYGIDSQEMLFHFLEKSFLPDLRAATMMDSPSSLESDTALALNRYLCNAVLPLLTNHSYYLADAEHHAALLDTTLHTVYSMNRLRSLTKNQRDAVSDFLVAITHELPPSMMIKLMRKVITDIQEMDENLVVPLRILTLHYERCTKYYGSGNIYGIASETEKRLSMLLFYAIFDSLGSRQYDPELFGKALPCLTAIGSAISPDYTLTTTSNDTDKIQKAKDHGVWNPDPVDTNEIQFDDDLKSVIAKFAEHFHDSWASRKIEKGWKYGDLYSRQGLTHPRLKPFALLPDFEKNFYEERCAECLRALLVWNYSIELADDDAADKAVENNTSLGISTENFNPRPVDLSNMTLEKDMTVIAEKMAEESHKIWAKKVFEDLSRGGNMPPQLVPWDLLTDFERRKDRFRAAEILKFLQYYGYRVLGSNRVEPSAERTKIDSERSSVEKRFAYNLLKKLIQYLEQAFLKMKTIKPSQELSRQNSFKKEGQDVKFFEKVVLPLMYAYFNAHKNYFLASSSIVQTGMASDKEKEMVANLFCRLASLLRIKNHAFGSVAKITVRCLQGLTQALDLRTLVKINSDIVRTGLLTFFNNCADDLFSAVEELQNGGQYSLLRGQNLKSWVSLEFANQMIIPVLTTMFMHLALNHFGSDLLLNEIQAACYKILDSAYLMNSLAATTSQRKSIAYEMDKHRPALGQCLAAFASCFPVAFLEDKFNKNNKYSLLAKSQDQSVQVQEMLQNLLAHIPQLDKLLMDVEQVEQSGAMYRDQPAVYDVDLPLVCSYLTYWWQFGPDSSNKSTMPVTDVNSEYINRIFRTLLQMIRNHIGVENASWLCRINFFSVQIIPYVSCDMVKDYILPVAERLRRLAEKAYKEEEHMRTHPDDANEGTIAEDNAHLVRDVYAYFPILMKYTDLHRAQWLKSPSWETDYIYENVAVIFKIWSLSQHFKREELNFMAQYEDESVAVGTGEMKTGKAAIAERKKKRREGQIRKDKHASSIVIACLKRLLPVGLNVFGGRELDIVQQAKEKFLAKEPEDKIREHVRSLLDVPAKTDPTDKNAWQLNLYRKIGKSQMRNKDVMTLEGIVEKITSMGQVVAILHVTEHPQGSMVNAWKTMLSSQRKRAVVACFRMIPLYGIPRHRAINFFLPAFNKLWLEDEDIGQDALIKELTLADETQEQVHNKSGDEEVSSGEKDEKFQAPPDPLKQLIQCFQRAATSEQSQAISIANDSLFVNFAQVMSKSVHIEDEDEGGENEGELDQAQKEEISQALRAEQAVLADRGAAIMCLMYLSASNGEPSDMVAEALQLGIHLLNGGNNKIQEMLIDYLQLKKDVRFFTSLAGLMNKCSVLNLEMYERQIKAEGLGMGAELASAANQNLNDSEFTCSLFRFLQLTCEGHNLEFQNYLRTQPGHTTSVNLINCTVDYLLRLQESVMDFYWHYSSKDVIDESGKEYFLRAIHVCSQVFNTLTESIQGPCTGNQMTLANSRLWDAINGFFFLFAHMMEKLYKNSTQLELLREFLNLQKDMIVLMLSMLEGNVLNGSIGKQMVDALVESEQNVEMILKFSDMFLKLKDLTTSQAFQDFDTNRDGWISPKEFQRAMESQKMYSVEEITYLMMCTDVNNDGKVDYMEFTERFHNPARDIGFNVAVLLTNLKEHITSDPRLEKIVKQASSLLEYFDPYLGRIEIMGSSKKVEKIYFEIQESWLEQWSKQQIRDSKNSFLFNVLQDDGGDQGKLEAFINFCEDTIFEMQYAAEISAGDLADSKIQRAKRQRDYFLQQTSAGAQISATFKTGFSYGISAANALKPANVKKIFDTANAILRSMTWAQLIIAIITLSIKASMKVTMFIYLITCTLFRFGYYLMMPDSDELQVEQAALPMPESVDMQYASPIWPSFQQSHRSCNYDVFGVHLPPTHVQVSTILPGQFKSEVTNASSPIQQSETVLKPSVATQQCPSLYETQSVSDNAYYNQAVSPAVSEYGVSDYYEPKIAEQIPPRSRGSLLNMLARNFKAIEKTTLYLAFFINVILLFHRIRIMEDIALGDEGTESVYISGVVLPYISYEVTGWMLAQLLYWISVLHAVASFALLVSFYQLKIPLITFKREKEVARRLMFDGCWLTEDDDEERSLTNTIFWYIDRIVISSKSFPTKYWDKFIRRKTRQKFRDQIDEETLITVLGENKSATDTAFDYRYACWLWLGVILTNGQFLYRVHYLLCSALGVFVSPFFYAFHLIDVVLSFPMLKAILQSVTHNLQQLILTIMMTLVVVYLYTVLAFNFFRKFYVQESEGEEPDRKCHNMLTCFIYHFYAGVRAGGGIGDELESPYGDDLEYWRMLYDISFFFFVIIILLAIMQGLIIDAFGELRDQQESATEKLASSCFICDIGKETFDRLPRGFEIHTSKEHNFANYLFFLQHLVNKDETEYTGQETYVREKYDNRDWEFFPYNRSVSYFSPK